MEQEDIKGSTRPGRGWTMRGSLQGELEGSPLCYAVDTTMICYVTATEGYQQKSGVLGMSGTTGSSRLRTRAYTEHDTLGEDLLLESLNEGVVKREDAVLKGKVGASVGLGAKDLNTT